MDVKGSDTIDHVKTKIRRIHNVATDREFFLDLMLADGSCERLESNEHTLNQLGIDERSVIWAIDIQAERTCT